MVPVQVARIFYQVYLSGLALQAAVAAVCKNALLLSFLLLVLLLLLSLALLSVLLLILR
jgi:hypothetical protein